MRAVLTGCTAYGVQRLCVLTVEYRERAASKEAMEVKAAAAAKKAAKKTVVKVCDCSDSHSVVRVLSCECSERLTTEPSSISLCSLRGQAENTTQSEGCLQ